MRFMVFSFVLGGHGPSVVPSGRAVPLPTDGNQME
jgi:hypothetical protein